MNEHALNHTVYHKHSPKIGTYDNGMHLLDEKIKK